MNDRIRFIEHRGKQVLSLDFSRCPSTTVEQILREVPGVIATQPLRSVRIIADFTGAAFSAEAMQAMKEAAVFDKPYVKKTAWVGAEDIPSEFKNTLSSYSLRDFPSFKSRDEALAWLVQD